MHRRHLFRRRRLRNFHVDGGKVSHAEVLPVERFREVVDVVDEKASSVDDDRLADRKVDGREILFDFFVRDFHCPDGKVRLDVVTVLGTPMTTHENRERILAVVVETNFDQFHSVVAQVVLHTPSVRACVRACARARACVSQPTNHVPVG